MDEVIRVDRKEKWGGVGFKSQVLIVGDLK